MYTQTKPLDVFALTPTDSPSTVRSPGSLGRASPTPASTTQVSATQIDSQQSTSSDRAQVAAVAAADRPIGRGLRRANGLNLHAARTSGASLSNQVIAEENEEESRAVSVVPDSNPPEGEDAGSQGDDESEGESDVEMNEQSDEEHEAKTTTTNAFDIMRKAAADQSASDETAGRMPLPAKGKAGNRFVETEAGMSDEDDMGLGAVSADEDETGLDKELEELVDREEMDEDVQAEGDKLVAEQFLSVPSLLSAFLF